MDSSNRRQSQEQPKRESYTRGYMSLNKEDKGKTLVRNLLPLKTEPISLPKNEFKADLGLV